MEKKRDYNGRWEANRKERIKTENETNENHPRWARDGAKPVGPAGDDRVVDDRLLAVEDDPTNKSELDEKGTRRERETGAVRKRE